MILLFLGPPGSGKGTQSQLLQKKLNIPHLSTGDMFRKAISEKTTMGLKAKTFMDKGEYVPDEVVIALIQERILQKDCENGFILDGFPRTQPQAGALDAMLATVGRNLSAVINFKIDESQLVNRLTARRTCKNCNRVIHEGEVSADSKPCAKTGQKCEFIQRDDDKPEVVRKRFEVYNTQTAPIISHYKTHPKFIEVNADQTPDAVTQSIIQRL